MFIIYELGTMVKVVVSTIGYLLFLSVNLLDNLLLSRAFQGGLTSEPIFILIFLFMLFLVLSILIKSFLRIFQLGFLAFLFYVTSEFVAGIILICILISFIGLLVRTKKNLFSDI